MKNRFLVIALACVCASFASADTLYTVAISGGIFSKIDTTSGAVTGIGALGVGYDFGDIAYDASSSTMFMIDGWGGGFRATNNLYKVNINTGAATLVGSTGVNDLFGLAYDPVSGKLFASKSTTSTGFFELNKTTGVASFIGDPGHSLDGITEVGSTGDVIGIEAGGNSPIFSVNRATGASTMINPGQGFVNNCGIAWVSSNNSVYTIDYSGSFYAYSVGGGYTRTLVANVGGSYDGLASTTVVPEPASMVALGAGLLALARRRRK